MQILKRTFFCLLVALLVAAGSIGCSKEARESRLLRSADAYFTSGEYDKAKVEYLKVLKDDPKNTTAVQRVGTIWLEQGSPLQAAPFLLAARELTPEDVNTRTKLISVFMYAGQLEEARKEALAILEQSPSHEEAMRLLAETSSSKEEVDDADQRLRALSADDKPGFHLAMATLLFRKDDPAAAEAEVRKALSLDPNSAEAHFALAKVLSKKDLIGADREFEAAAELAPRRSPIRLAYAEFKLRNGASDEAANLLNEITRDTPDFLPAWRLLAQISFAEKKLDESLKLLDNVILRDPANIEARILQAQVWLAQDQAKKAIEGLEALDASYPRVLVIKYQLARAYLQDKNPAQAALVLKQALAENSNYAEAILLLCEINIRGGNALEAVTAMLDLLKQRPGLLQAQIVLAQAYQSLGRLNDAAAIFRDHVTANPQSATAHLSLGLVLRAQDKFDEARITMETAQRLAPKSALVISQLIDLDIQGKDYDAALRRLHELRKTRPDSPDVSFLEGKIYAAQGKWDSAEVALLKTLKRNPAYPHASDLLISSYLAANKLSNAIAFLQSELSRNPNDARALMVVAMMHERIKDFASARETYEKLLSLKPDSAPALNNLAYLYAEHFDLLEKAQDLAQKARALQPTDAGIADTLGWVLYKRGNYQQALTLLEESAQKLPENSEIQCHLGLARYMMGEKNGAREALLRAATAPSDFSGKEEAQRKLSLLKSAGDEAVAFKDRDTALEHQPSDPLARMRLGESYEKEGAFTKAAVEYEEALKLNPNLLAAVIKLAQLNAGPLQASEKALEFGKKARALAPDDPKITSILGAAAYQTGNFKWAHSLLQESARQLPEDYTVLHDFAWAAYSLGKVSEARQAMQGALSNASDSRQVGDAKLFLEMVALDPESVDDEGAPGNFENVLQRDPTYVPALMAQAALLESRGEPKGAVKIYRDVLNRFPDFAPAQKRLASLYQGTIERRDEAYDLAVKARRTLPDDPELAQILAKLSYQRNEFAYAVQLLKKSAQSRPLDAENLYYLGMSQFKSKNIVQAREALDQALAAGLHDPLASDARRMMKDLQESN